MRKATSLIITSALVGTLALTSFTPAAFAQEQNGREIRNEQRGHSHGMRGNRGGRQGGFIRLMCSEDGAERLENAIDLVDNRITLTDEQTTLLADLKSSALTAQTEFADNCVTPTRDGNKDMIDGLKNRQANMKAHVEAMDDVVPALEAFYDSLTDDQKADLKPKRSSKRGGKGKNGPKHG